MNEKIAVVGLGYVGLPVALAFARRFPGVVGYDIDVTRVAELRQGVDRTHEVDADALRGSTIRFTSDLVELRGASFFVVTVPTPVDANHQPDLGPVVSASRAVGRVLERGGVVVYESTVYPGVTEEICGPILEEVSGLVCGVDFTLGYSPERINPGDREHTLETIVKVVSGQDTPTVERVAAAYGAIVSAGVHRAPSIKVAEAAKVIENTQRDLNIALMNELAIIFGKLGVRTADVLAAAGTKWNFLPFRPGLVGGHCIGVDPYYLTAKAEQLGYHPEVILAGRRINDGMGSYLAQRVIKSLVAADLPVKGARVAVLGLSFKENVPDLRNSRVPDMVTELRELGAHVLVHDPLVSPDEAAHEYGIRLCTDGELHDLDAVVLAVVHRQYLEQPLATLLAGLRSDGLFVDVKSSFGPRHEALAGRHYWSL